MKQILKITNIDNFNKYIVKINDFLSDLIYEYPCHHIWFEGVVSELRDNQKNEREILFVVNDKDKIIGVSILKKTEFEKKICTLRVANEYQKRGLGTMLVKESCRLLETDTPIISVSQTRINEFIRLFKRFGFVLEKVYCGKYRPMINEYCYNGILMPESILKQNMIVDKPSLMNHSA